MKKTLIILLFPIVLFSQEVDSTLNKWIPSMVAGFNISQVSFTNWAKGGDNSISWVLNGNFDLSYKTETWRFKNNLKASYGQSQQGDQGTKTNENDIYLESVFSYNVGWAVDPYFSNTVRTQIAAGYDYEVIPYTEIANFFDPGYITQALGFTYDKLQNFTTRLGVAFQETFASDFASRYTDDPETTNEIEDFKFDTGLESVSDANYELDTNLFYKGKLRLFTRFSSLDVWDVRFDNTITAKVNNWLNVNLSLILVHEISESRRTQLKQGLQIGIVYTLF